jgi:hypothetical protein
MSVRFVARGALLILAIFALRADAQAPPKNSEAAAEFDRAVTAYRANRCQEAADMFQRAYQIEPSKETLIQAARAYVCASDQLMQAAAIAKPDDDEMVCLLKRELEKLLRAASAKRPRVKIVDFALETNPFEGP